MSFGDSVGSHRATPVEEAEDDIAALYPEVTASEMTADALISAKGCVY